MKNLEKTWELLLLYINFHLRHLNCKFIRGYKRETKTFARKNFVLKKKKNILLKIEVIEMTMGGGGTFLLVSALRYHSYFN